MASLVTSIIGGIQGASAAKNAASTAAGGQNAAGQTVTNAANNANAGIGSAVTSGQAGLTGAGAASGAGATNAAATGIAGLTGAASNAGGNALAAGNAAANGVTGAGTAAGTGALDAAGSANSLLSQYLANGNQASQSLASFMAPGGAGATPFTMAMAQNSGAMQFAQQQGQQALDRAAAAHGAAMGGGQMKALEQYSQGLASQQYQQAFQDYTTQQQNTFSNLSSMASAGQAAANQAGANMQGAAQYSGTAGLQAANLAGQFGTNASQYAGTLGTNAAATSAQLGENAAQFAGSQGLTAAQGSANLGMQGALGQSQNTMQAGVYTGNTQISAANDLAGGILGSANAWNQMLNGIGGVGNMALTGGFSGAMGNLAGIFGSGSGSGNMVDDF